MLHFYDGQIRRYITQTIRVLSNFVVKYGDGSLVRVPVMYGDADRQVAGIIKNNSENSVSSTPRISVYISGLDIDRNRLSDSSYIGKMHFREREIDNSSGGDIYTTQEGKNYTVERLMPTPFKLTMKVDIWSANTDQKLQILEQILVLFNPSLELQTSDNYIDWTSLTVLELASLTWSSKTIPVGTDTPIDVGTLTLETPIWISPPVKVKHLGVITNVVASIYERAEVNDSTYIDGLGIDLGGTEVSLGSMLSSDRVTITNYHIQVYNGQAILLGKNENVIPAGPTLDIPTRQGPPLNWELLFAEYPGKLKAGSSRIFLIQQDGTEVIGTIAVNQLDPTVLAINWDPDTYPKNYGIDSNGYIQNVDFDPLGNPLFDINNSLRASPGTFDAIIDPQKVYPGHGMQNVVAGDRFLIIEDIGSEVNNFDNSYTGVDGMAASNGPDAWKSTSGEDFIAKANDIIEWDGNQWNVIFDSNQKSSVLLYQTNIYTGVQYAWHGVMWTKSFEGEYRAGRWRIEL